jgi:hypothetical protein
VDHSRSSSPSVITRGWFAVVYWALVGVGVIAVVLAFTVGTAEQRSVTGAIVMTGVLLLTVARLVIARRRRDGQAG